MGRDSFLFLRGVRRGAAYYGSKTPAATTLQHAQVLPVPGTPRGLRGSGRTRCRTREPKFRIRQGAGNCRNRPNRYVWWGRAPTSIPPTDTTRHDTTRHTLLLLWCVGDVGGSVFSGVSLCGGVEKEWEQGDRGHRDGGVRRRWCPIVDRVYSVSACVDDSAGGRPRESEGKTSNTMPGHEKERGFLFPLPCVFFFNPFW